jgi:hypothetical protein
MNKLAPADPAPSIRRSWALPRTSVVRVVQLTGVLLTSVACSTGGPAASVPAPTTAGSMASPSASLAEPTDASSPEPRFEVVATTIKGDSPVTFRVLDAGGQLTDVRPASRAIGRTGEAGLRDEDVTAVKLRSDTIVLTWVGTVCDRGMTASLMENDLVLTPDPRPGCDTGRVPRSVVLAFASRVDVKSMAITLER